MIVVSILTIMLKALLLKSLSYIITITKFLAIVIVIIVRM